MLAVPSNVLIIADRTAGAVTVAADIIPHTVHSMVARVNLVTMDQGTKLVFQVDALLEQNRSTTREDRPTPTPWEGGVPTKAVCSSGC